MTAMELPPARNPLVASLAGDLFVPIGEQVPIDALAEPEGAVYLEVIRHGEQAPWPHVIDDVGPEGAVILAGAPGAGKSRLALQWVHAVAYGLTWAGFAADEPGRVLIYDLENQWRGLKAASLSLAKWGSVPTDRIGIDAAAEAQLVRIVDKPKGERFGERLLELRDLLTEAQTEGRPFRMVVIDMFQNFVMPYPTGGSANNQHWEKECSAAINALALEFHVCIIVVHHTNKIGEVSGSNGIGGGATAVFLLLRDKGGTEGRLICDGKHRHGSDAMCFRGQFIGGKWEMFDKVNRSQIETAEGTGKRQLCNWLHANGPAILADVCAGNPDIKPKTVSDLLSRLRGRGFVVRSADGLWDVPRSAGEAQRPVCAGCGAGLDGAVLAAGQTTHPNPECERMAKEKQTPAPVRPPMPWGPGVPADYWSGDEGGQLADVIPITTVASTADLAGNSSPAWRNSEPIGDEHQGANDAAQLPDDEHQAGTCDHCGLAVTPGDDSHDCGDPAASEWSAAKALHNSLRKIRRPVVKFIAPEGNPLGQGEGRQHRDMAQWVAAADVASSVVTGYGFERRGLADQFGPDRMVRTFDKVQAFFSAADQPILTAGLLEHFGPFDCDPRELGRAAAAKDGRPEGLAGIARIECPAWQLPGVPHPLGRRADPGEPITVPTGMLELLWRLHREDRIPRPVVLDSWLGPRFTRLFTSYAELVKAERGKVPHDSPADKAIKTRGSKGLSMMRSQDKNGGIYRPDWYAAVAGESMIRLWIKALGAALGGDELVAMRNCDEVSWLVPEGADPETWTPAGYVLGDAWGQYRPKGVLFDPAHVDSSIPADRVTRPASQRRKVKVAGPVPLSMWRHHA